MVRPAGVDLNTSTSSVILLASVWKLWFYGADIHVGRFAHEPP